VSTLPSRAIRIVELTDERPGVEGWAVGGSMSAHYFIEGRAVCGTRWSTAATYQKDARWECGKCQDWIGWYNGNGRRLAGRTEDAPK
jgi:hypothetical protein